jgi:hypothetical protein
VLHIACYRDRSVADSLHTLVGSDNTVRFSSVGIVTRLQAGRPVLDLPPRPDRLWRPPSLISSEFRS